MAASERKAAPDQRIPSGLVTHYLLFVMSLADRVVAIAGITTGPRPILDASSGTQPDGLRSRHSALETLPDHRSRQQVYGTVSPADSRGGTKVIRLLPRSPNLNAYAERFVRSIKEECLNRMIFVGQASLRRAVREFIVHYHQERNHQGLGNRLLRLPKGAAAANGSVRRSARLGGVLNFYYREAA